MADSFQPELLSALLDGQLSPEQKAAVEAHLQNHPQDATVVDDLQRLRKQLRGLPALSAPGDFAQKVLQRIQESAPVSATHPMHSGTRTATKTNWLLACAASLVALLLAGLYFILNRDDANLVALSNPGESKSSKPADRVNAPSKSPNDSAVGTKDKESIAKVDDRPVGPDSDQASAGVVKPQSDAGIAAMPEALETGALESAQKLNSLEEPAAAAGLGDGVASQDPSGVDRDRSEFAGGGSGDAMDDNKALAKGAPDAKGELSEQQPAPAVVQPTTPADAFVRLDQLIFVQVPADQSAEEWIASVFRQAEVQMDLSDEPDSFGEIVQQRVDDKKQAHGESDDGQALAGNESRGLKNRREVAEKTQPELSPAPEYLKPDSTTTAYWVDAEVRQIRNIMDRLDGAVIVGFPNPGKWGPHGETQLQQKSFPGNSAIARRLGRLDVLAPAEGSLPDEQPNRQQEEQELSESQRAIDALGLRDQPLTARYRILFVFHASASPEALKSGAIESKPSPVK